MLRRFGEPVKPGQRYRLRPGAYAAITDGRDFLLTHQQAPRPEFQLPGGGVDPGEHPLPALHREVLEETGWRIGAARRLGAYRRFAYMPEYDLWAEKLCTVYLARAIRRHGPPSAPGHSALWSPPRTAVRLLASAGDRHFLALAARLGPTVFEERGRGVIGEIAVTGEGAHLVHDRAEEGGA